MAVQIRPLKPDEMETLVELSLLAWAPVFESFEQVLGATIYTRIYPDWLRSQRATIEEICALDSKYTTWVADLDTVIAGFVTVIVNSETLTGEIELLAVHPDHQNRGIGTALNRFALDQMRAAGMHLAVVATGGDPGHAPARRSYEKAGFIGLPLVRYYKDL